MRIAIPFLSFFVLAVAGNLPGIDLTKTGPDRPAPTIFEQGGGGGP